MNELWTYEDIIRGYNKSWWYFYYEDVVDKKHYQLTRLNSVGESFYNCAHFFALPSQHEITNIKAYFTQYNLIPTLYIEEKLYHSHITHFNDLGYIPASMSENERWWIILKKDYAKTEVFTTHDIVKVILEDSRLVRQFLAVNAEANELNEDIVRQLYTHMVLRYDNNVCLLLALNEKAIPVACGAIVKIGDIAYLSEGGVTPDHRQRGLHTALVYKRLHIAFNEWQCKSCVCVTTRDAWSNHTLHKTGFTELFSRILLKKHPKAKH